MECISLGDLWKLARGSLPPDRAEAIRSHLTGGCQRCCRRWQQLLTAHSPDDSPSEATGAFRRTGVPSRSLGHCSLPAILLVDSFAEGRLLGFRSTGPTSRHLLYRTSLFDIDVHIDRADEERCVDIIGQVMSRESGSMAHIEAEIQLLRGPRLILQTRTNEYGEFIFDDVREGTYDLRVAFPELTLDVAGLSATLSSP